MATKVGAINLEYERSILSAGWTGMLGYNLDLATAYAQQRIQFGHPIVKYPHIREMQVRMKINYDISKLLLYRAAWIKDQGLPAALEAS